MPIINDFFRFCFSSFTQLLDSKCLEFMIHLIWESLRKLQISDFGIFIKILFAIKSEKVTISGWGYHSCVFDMFLLNVDKPRFKEFKIKMQINELFILFKLLWNVKFKFLFIPSFANPTYIFEYFRWGSRIMSSKNYVIWVNFSLNQRMQRSELFFFND